jgi:hypothetical protein
LTTATAVLYITTKLVCTFGLEQYYLFGSAEAFTWIMHNLVVTCEDKKALRDGNRLSKYAEFMIAAYLCDIF